MKREAEMVNLVFSDSANGILMHKRELFRIDKNSLCSIELYLHGGDISLPFDVKKRKDFYETGYCKRYCCTAQRQINKFSKMLKSDGEICIWLSRKCIDEYLGMLWTVYNYKNYAKNIFLCDCTELVDAIAYFSDIEIQTSPLKNRYKLTYNDIEQISEYWERLRNENTGLRILESGNPVSKPVNYFDRQIFEIAGNRFIDAMQLMGIMLARKESAFMLEFLTNRLYYLVKQNEFTVVQYGYIGRIKSFGFSIIKRTNPIYPKAKPKVLFTGQLKRICLESYNDPSALKKENNRVLQKLVITNNGKARIYEYVIIEITAEDTYRKNIEPLRCVDIKTDKEKTDKIIKCFEQCFSGNYTLHKVAGYGEWNLRLTNGDGKVTTIGGPLINEFDTQCGDLSEVVRTLLGCDDLFMFDKNRKQFDKRKKIDRWKR